MVISLMFPKARVGGAMATRTPSKRWTDTEQRPRTTHAKIYSHYFKHDPSKHPQPLLQVRPQQDSPATTSRTTPARIPNHYFKHDPSKNPQPLLQSRPQHKSPTAMSTTTPARIPSNNVYYNTSMNPQQRCPLRHQQNPQQGVHCGS